MDDMDKIIDDIEKRKKIKILCFAIITVLSIILICIVVGLYQKSEIEMNKANYIRNVKKICLEDGINDAALTPNNEELVISSAHFNNLSDYDKFKIEKDISEISDYKYYPYIESAGKKYDIPLIMESHYEKIDYNSVDSVGSVDSNGSGEVTDDVKGACWDLAEKVVTASLKSPSTAKFPFSYNDEGVSFSKSGNTYTVTGWVDAENSYGATLRNNFTVTMTKSGYGSDAKFTSNSCIIN